MDSLTMKDTSISTHLSHWQASGMSESNQRIDDMAEVKWIKIVTDIFDDEKILIIESMPEADSIIVIWFKLLCLAGKQNNSGVFMIRDRIPYTDEMFSAIFRRPINTLRLAFKTFESLGMIEIINDAVTIPNWGKHQSLEQMEARRLYERDRKREYRKRQQLLSETSVDSPLPSSGQCPGQSPSCPTDVHSLEEDIDRDIDTDRDEDRERDTEKKGKKKGAERSGDHSTLAANEPSIFELPLNDGTMYGVTQSEIDKYSELYPAVDVPQEIRGMIGWLDSNPAKRKTRGGVRRFMNNWLSRTQDQGGTNGYVKLAKQTPAPAQSYGKPKKPMNERTVTEAEFETGFFADIMNRPRSNPTDN